MTENFLRTEVLVTAYMLLCTWLQEYQSEDSQCLANPAQFTATFVLYIFLPFFISRVYSYFFVHTPQQVFNYVLFGLMLNQAIAGIWEVIAVQKIFQLKDCEFNLAYFNLIFYCGYMMHALISWFAAPLVAWRLYNKITGDTDEINRKI